jgi:hypothetical protein
MDSIGAAAARARPCSIEIHHDGAQGQFLINYLLAIFLFNCRTGYSKFQIFTFCSRCNWRGTDALIFYYQYPVSSHQQFWSCCSWDKAGKFRNSDGENNCKLTTITADDAFK